MGRFGISLMVVGILVGAAACQRNPAEEPAATPEPAVEAAPPAVGDTAPAPTPEATAPVTPGETSPSETPPDPATLLPDNE
jgi:hypothetical protein